MPNLTETRVNVALEINDFLKLKTISEDSGIKRSPDISRLSMDFVNGLPYDPMKKCLLGFVCHLPSLLLGRHPKSTLNIAHYIQSETVIATMKFCIEQCQSIIPAGWGCLPLSLCHTHHFKAEDFKNFGLFYAPFVFSEPLVSTDISKLWNLVSWMLHIVLDHTLSLKHFRSKTHYFNHIRLV